MSRPTMVYICNDGCVWFMDNENIVVNREFVDDEHGRWVTLSEYESGGYSAPIESKNIPHETPGTRLIRDRF